MDYKHFDCSNVTQEHAIYIRAANLMMSGITRLCTERGVPLKAIPVDELHALDEQTRKQAEQDFRDGLLVRHPYTPSPR